MSQKISFILEQLILDHFMCSLKSHVLSLAGKAAMKIPKPNTTLDQLT